MWILRADMWNVRKYLKPHHEEGIQLYIPASVREIFGQSEEKLVAESWSPSRQAAQDQFHLLWILDQSVFMFVVNA